MNECSVGESKSEQLCGYPGLTYFVGTSDLEKSLKNFEKSLKSIHKVYLRPGYLMSVLVALRVKSTLSLCTVAILASYLLSK